MPYFASFESMYKHISIALSNPISQKEISGGTSLGSGRASELVQEWKDPVFGANWEMERNSRFIAGGTLLLEEESNL